MDLRKKIRTVKDFPKKGIGFKDITTLIGDGPALRTAIAEMKKRFAKDKIDAVVGVESRGFLFAAILAHEWGVGIVPVRKPGKLPAKTISESYSLEYGTDSLEMHRDALRKGQKIVIVDDLLATGGTVLATAKLVERLGAEVCGCCFLIELCFLKGREKLKKYRIESLVQYAEE